MESKTKPYLSPYYFSFREPAKDKQHFSVAVSWRQKIKQEMCRWSWRVICERNNLSCLVQLNKRGRGKEGEVMDDGEEEAVHVMRIAPSRLHRTSPVGKRRLLWHHRLWQLGKLWPGSCSWNDMLFQPLLSRDLHDNSTYLTGNFCFCFLYSRLVQDRTPIINQNVPLADGLVQHQCTP